MQRICEIHAFLRSVERLHEQTWSLSRNAWQT